MKNRIIISLIGVAVVSGILISTSGVLTQIESDLAECYYMDDNEIPRPCKIIDGWYDALVYSEPVTRYSADSDCNNMDGRTEAQCFKDALESCTTAVTHDVIYTIEGDPMYLVGIIKDDCKIHVTFDNSGDRFGGSDKGIRSYLCDKIELQEKHMWVIDSCTEDAEFQINYQAQDFASDEKCRTIDGKWSYESHNCVYNPNEFDCEAVGGFQGCMTREQIGDRRDVCNIVCEFEPMDRK